MKIVEGAWVCVAAIAVVSIGCTTEDSPDVSRTTDETGPRGPIVSDITVPMLDGGLVPRAPRTPVCGDGVVSRGEECDDGDANGGGDGCSADCMLDHHPACGDGSVDDGEECDDGNTMDGDGCSANCTVEDHGTCGDGVQDVGESCDDGNLVDGDGCSSHCGLECPQVCGNGILEAGEECDDGNQSDGDGCSADCALEPACPMPGAGD